MSGLKGAGMKRFSQALQVLAVAAVLFSPAAGWARHVDCADATIAGENFKNLVIERLGGWGESPTATVEGCQVFKEKGRVVGYFLKVAPKGYIMLNPLTQMDPVKAYSTESDLDLFKPTGFTRLLRDAMGRTRDEIEKHHGSLELLPDDVELAPPQTRAQWDALLGQAPDTVTLAPDTAVSSLTTGPLLTTSWYQGAPFNNSCPMGSGGRSVVGCVATAAAQIMKFWNYPLSGVGSKSYAWSGDDSCPPYTNVGGGTLSATFSDTYDWANMTTTGAGATLAAQQAALAELSYEVGVAVSMDYGRCGSGSYTADVAAALPAYFNYAPTTAVKYHTSYTAANWFKEIRKEFDNPLPRPAQYRILTHSIVCDGYQELAGSNRIHLNYGWNESHNAWYTVDSLYQVGGGTTADEFIVSGIQPQNRAFIDYIGPDYTLREAYWNHSGSLFTAGALPGGGLSANAPSLAVFNGRQYLAVRGGGSEIFVKSRTALQNFDQNAFVQVPGSTDDSPVLVAYNNQLYLFVRASAWTFYKSMNAAGTWSAAWTEVIGSNTAYRPGLVVYNSKLYYFETDPASNRIYYKSMNDAGAWDAAFNVFPTGTTNAGPSPVVYNNELWVLVRGIAGSKLWYAKTTTPDTPVSWSVWTALNGSSASAPAVAVVPETNVMHIAVRGNSLPKIWHLTYNGSSFSSWQAMDTVDADAQTVDSPVLNVFYVNGDQSL
jgi:hypothetical protein